METTPVANYNGADDPAIWVHPTESDSSFFVGTDKNVLGRLELYNLDGTRYWSTESGTRYNNVDVLYGFILGNDTIDLVSASNNTDNTLDYYKIDPETRTLIDVTGNTATGLTNLYGYITYQDLCTGKYYSFLTLRNSAGYCYQFEFYDNGEGGIDTELVRIINNLNSRTEGMAADPTYGDLYIAQESIGIWKYGAAPEDGTERILVDSVSGPNLTALVEGLCIYHISDSLGYLLASSQGADDFQVYTRDGDNQFLGSFELIDGEVDGCYHTDGIDVMSYPVGSAYPNGVFIAHDLSNDDGFQNYKAVPWQRIADSLGLEISPFNPRSYLANLCDTIPIDTIPVDTVPVDTVPIDTLPVDTNIIDTNVVDTVKFIHYLESRSFIIYPNPVRETLRLQFNNQALRHEDLKIYSIRGKLLLRKRVYSDQIDVSFLEPGLYIIQIGDVVHEFVKE